VQRLSEASELLDGDLRDAAALVGNLRDLGRINAAFGGVRLSQHAIDALIEPPDPASNGHGAQESVEVIDIGTGGADIPMALLRARPRWSITAVDSRQEVLDAARVADPRIAGLPGLTLGLADGLALPFADGSFDVAHASLVLHHLAPEDARRLVREMARVARRGIVLNDLERGWLNWLGAWLLLHVATRNPLTRNDGPLSVRRSYLLSEAVRLVEGEGLVVVHRRRGFLGHRWAVAAVRR
jgi:SAM-dependent methyltransferase